MNTDSNDIVNLVTEYDIKTLLYTFFKIYFVDVGSMLKNIKVDTKSNKKAPIKNNQGSWVGRKRKKLLKILYSKSIS